MKKRYWIGFIVWNIVLFIGILALSKAKCWYIQEPVQFMSLEEEQQIRLTGDDKVIFRFQNPYIQVDNIVLRFGDCKGHTEGELSVSIYDEEQEYYTYNVPVYAFGDESFYLYTNVIEGLKEKAEYEISVAVSGMGSEGLLLYGVKDEKIDTLRIQEMSGVKEEISPFWGANGIQSVFSKDFQQVYYVWLLLDILVVAIVVAIKKRKYISCSILTLLVTGTLIGLVVYKEETKETRTYDYWTHRNVAEFVEIPVKEGEIRQSFKAGYDKLEQFILLFDNYAPEDTVTINVTLEDEKGKPYYNWSVGTMHLTGTTFTLMGVPGEELQKGKEYILSISLDGSGSEITVRGVAQEDMHASLKKLTVDGKESVGTALYLYQKYQVVFSYGKVWCLLLSLAAVLYLFALLSNVQWLGKVWDKLSILLIVYISYHNIESLSGNLSIIGMGYALRNCLVILSVYLIIRAIWKRGANYIVPILMLIIGMANYYVLQFRGSELLITDVKSIFTAVSVLGNYEFTLPPVVFTEMLLTGIFLFFQGIMDRKGEVKSPKTKIWVSAACLTIGVLLLVIQFVSLDVDKFYSFTISNNFKEYGWCYSNLYITKFSAVEKPKGYSDKRVEKIINDLEDQGKQDVISPQNLIVIMNESFSDLSILGELKTNQDYMPYVRSLSENTVKGNLHVATFGGNTCITEYEFLTGNSMYFLPTGTIPYQNACEDWEEGMVRTLQAQDYYAVAMHPYGPTNWERDKVYPALGFDEFLSLEDYGDAELLRNYVSDKADYDKIIEYYENFDRDENLFIFNVTMQNHGGYDINNGVLDTNIKIENFESSIGDTYLSLISESDKAFAYLLEYFSQVEEPTMIVMFGDHMPALPDSFYEKIYGDELEDVGKWRRSMRYTTSYVIWTNYESDFEEIADISTNYLGSYVLQCAGLELPKYNEFLLEQRKRIPVLAMGGIYDTNGKYIPYEEVPEEWLSDYKILQYLRLEDRKSKFYDIFTVEE